MARALLWISLTVLLGSCAPEETPTDSLGYDGPARPEVSVLLDTRDCPRDPADAAWPALARLRRSLLADPPFDLQACHPGTDEWPRVQEFVARHEQDLTDLRAAVQRSHMGRSHDPVQELRESIRTAQMRGDAETVFRLGQRLEQLVLRRVTPRELPVAPYLDLLRSARALVLAARVASEVEDYSHAHDNLRAALRLGQLECARSLAWDYQAGLAVVELAYAEGLRWALSLRERPVGLRVARWVAAMAADAELADLGAVLAGEELILRELLTIAYGRDGRFDAAAWRDYQGGDETDVSGEQPSRSEVEAMLVRSLRALRTHDGEEGQSWMHSPSVVLSSFDLPLLLEELRRERLGVERLRSALAVPLQLLAIRRGGLRRWPSDGLELAMGGEPLPEGIGFLYSQGQGVQLWSFGRDGVDDTTVLLEAEPGLRYGGDDDPLYPPARRWVPVR